MNSNDRAAEGLRTPRRDWTASLLNGAPEEEQAEIMRRQRGMAAELTRMETREG